VCAGRTPLLFAAFGLEKTKSADPDELTAVISKSGKSGVITGCFVPCADGDPAPDDAGPAQPGPDVPAHDEPEQVPPRDGRPHLVVLGHPGRRPAPDLRPGNIHTHACVTENTHMQDFPIDNEAEDLPSFLLLVLVHCVVGGM
jgi:hypothetical protein